MRIMLDVAKNSRQPAKTADIAARQDIPKKYAEQICAALAKSGLLKSGRGAAGGYALAKPAREYTAYEILRALEGDLLPVECAAPQSDCARSGGCEVRKLWTGLYGCIRDYLQSVTLQDLLSEGSSADFYEI